MTSRGNLSGCFISCLLVILYSANCEAGRFVAFSLNAAEKQLKEHNGSNANILELAGISRLAGLVCEPESQDLILVGQLGVSEHKPTLDDFVVALRATLVHGEWPAVSIDRVPETDTTGKQLVRFQGRIAGTSFGRRLFEADVALKELALGTLSAELFGVRSYFDLCSEDIEKNGRGADVNSRFWFYPGAPALVARKGVFAIQRLEISVCTQVMTATDDQISATGLRKAKDPLGEAFADSLTANYSDIGLHVPQIARLKPLFDSVAIATGIRNLPFRPDLDFWLQEYDVGRVETPDTYPLLKRVEDVAIGKTSCSLKIDGGVKLKALMIRLRDGDVTALREAVLKSKPPGNPLSWPVPIDGWHIPGTPELNDQQFSTNEGAFSDKLSCTVHRSLITTDSMDSPEHVRHPEAMSIRAPTFGVTQNLSAQHDALDIGGVMLSDTAHVAGQDGTQVNLAGGNFALVVDGKNARIAPATFRKFITALWCVYYCKHDPGLSIDPIAPDSDKHMVRYIGRVINTDLGRVMREADYVMKKWAVGTDRPDFPGFHSVDALMAEHGRTQSGVSRRFWFVPDELSFKRGDDLLLFDSGRMRVNTEYVDQQRWQGAAASDEAFARFFTENYDAIAEKYPVYRELFEYAKMVALAKHLKEEGVPLHWFLLANKDLVLTEDSPGTVDQLAKDSEYFRGMTVMGGVDLVEESHYVYDREAVEAIQQAVSHMPSVPIHTAAGRPAVQHVPDRFSFDLGKHSYSVMPQHSLTAGKDRRGIRYQTDLALRDDGQPSLEIVRYFNPRNREGGQFGAGWHLLIPYEVQPQDDKRQRFLNADIPQRMVVQSLLDGTKEVLSFSPDRYAAAGYVPEEKSPSQIIGLFLMSDHTYRLADKLGNQFHFDALGRMTEMRLSPYPEHRMRIGYADTFTSAFARDPYQIVPVGQSDSTLVPFLNVMLPKRVRITDLVNDTTEVLVFDAADPAPGYKPEDQDSSRYEVAAMLTNGGLELLDKHGNRIRFDSGWRFSSMLPTTEHRMIQTVTMGNRKVTCGYTIDHDGRVVIATAGLSDDKPFVPATYVVRYDYDDAGRLCRVRRPGSPSLTSRPQRHQQLAVARQ